jgi:hypothetical protein
MWIGDKPPEIQKLLDSYNIDGVAWKNIPVELSSSLAAPVFLAIKLPLTEEIEKKIKNVILTSPQYIVFQSDSTGDTALKFIFQTAPPLYVIREPDELESFLQHWLGPPEPPGGSSGVDLHLMIQYFFHELKTPLSSLGLGLDMLGELETSSTFKKDLDLCQKAYQKLHTLAKDFPSFFRPPSTSTVVRAQPLRELAQSLYWLSSIQMQKKSLNEGSQKNVSRFLKTLKGPVSLSCGRESLVKAFQELIHFLVHYDGFRDPEAIQFMPYVAREKFFIDLNLKRQSPFLESFAESNPSLDHLSLRHLSRNLRDNTKHLYFDSIQETIQNAGFKLWLLPRASGVCFRFESIQHIQCDTALPRRAKTQPPIL